MKTVLAVIGVVLVLGLLVLIGGGIYVYKKGSSFATAAIQKQVDVFIQTKKPPTPVSDALRRAVNAGVLRKSYTSVALLAFATASTTDGVVTDQELAMVNDAAQIMERGDVDQKTYADFAQKYQTLAPQPVQASPAAAPGK